MSSYRDFVSDFPRRCGDLLTRFHGKAEFHDREVTLMLSVATAGIVIPFERLRPENSHPTADNKRFQEAADKLNGILEQRFLGSPLWNASVGSWVFAKKVENETLQLDSWPELQHSKPLSDMKKGISVLKHLRNALAHGNIFTRGRQIELIVFLSRSYSESDKYDMLAVHPDELLQFLSNWFSVLSEIQIPEGLVGDPCAA